MNENLKYIPYGDLVTSEIRRKYSESEELAIQRQRFEKPEEFEVYYAYCEACKEKAKQIIAGTYIEEEEII